MTCPVCAGRGLRFNPDSDIGHHGGIELCSCVLDQCRCGGQKPYTYWDDDSWAQRCPCSVYRYRLRQTESNLRNAQLPAKARMKFRDALRDRAPDGTPAPRVAKVRRYIEQLAASKAPPKRGLFLHGIPGTGKTFLACVILNELILRRGRAGRFVSLSRGFFHRLRDTFSEDSDRHGQAYQMLEELVSIPYMVIDDLGVQRGTDWEEEVLYDLVDGRYADERFTIVTTNAPLEDIEGISKGRIYSRLCEMCHRIELEGPDWRQVRDG